MQIVGPSTLEPDSRSSLDDDQFDRASGDAIHLKKHLGSVPSVGSFLAQDSISVPDGPGLTDEG